MFHGRACRVPALQHRAVSLPQSIVPCPCPGALCCVPAPQHRAVSLPRSILLPPCPRAPGVLPAGVGSGARPAVVFRAELVTPPGKLLEDFPPTTWGEGLRGVRVGLIQLGWIRGRQVRHVPPDHAVKQAGGTAQSKPLALCFTNTKGFLFYFFSATRMINFPNSSLPAKEEIWVLQVPVGRPQGVQGVCGTWLLPACGSCCAQLSFRAGLFILRLAPSHLLPVPV